MSLAGISSNMMTKKVSVSAMHWLVPVLSLPMTCKQLPSSLEYDLFQVSQYRGWRWSWRYSREVPVDLSRIDMDKLVINNRG